MEDREVLQGLQTNEQVFLVCGLIVYLPTYFFVMKYRLLTKICD